MLVQAACLPKCETVKRPGCILEHGTAGEQIGEVAAQEDSTPTLQPREPKEKSMQHACKDAWPSLGTEHIDVPLAELNAPCMAKRPHTAPCMSKCDETQHENKTRAPQTESISSRKTPPHDSLIGSTLLHSHSDESRHEAITHSL